MSAQDIRLVLLDVDGVLTDGRLWYGPEGEVFKAFHARDGLGVRLLQESGIEVGIITGRSSEIVVRRAADLHIQCVFQGAKDKIDAYEKIVRERKILDEQVAYMGDDLPDIPVLERVGLPACPSDAVPEVMSRARFRSSEPGGLGAVRTLAEFILKSRNGWERACSDSF
jgi:3-deoxy-D-manno-octulosonate 8-phosphate phosphatase (KDO 8-P phosphatase)